ncbi:MAG TPA: excinuclease ABC subunit UvrC [Gaiellales bacterium]|jgi:excinuclease ABC subunit C|nr:excinuclease ABC subunit UvrC [Gaiellales bacterium]
MAATPATDRGQRLEARLSALPQSPGVYLFRSAGGEVLYVGKAKSLRSRVRSYFRREAYATARTAELVDRIDDIEFVGAESETEALFLEQNLIKRHRPPFNIRLRDDKSYPYIAVTVSDEYPRVMFTRERHRRGVQYFGPYSSAKKVRETLDVLNRVFPYRPCEGPTPGRRSGIPCLDYHIGRCAAPCVGYISREDYRAVIDSVIEFLSGRVRPLERRLEAAMKEASAAHEFEEAARYRNRLMAVRHLSERQVADRRSLGSADVLGIACSEDTANVQLFHLRDGRLSDRHGFYLENTAGRSESDVLWGFALEYYGGQVAIPAQVIVPRGFDDPDLLELFLGDRRGSAVEVRSAQRGEKRRLANLAQRNARMALDHDTLLRERTRARRVEALEELREALNLEVLPVRIECFDISNLGQANPVASMAVFEDAVAKKSDYRKFGIRSEGPDDFAMIAEAVTRRFARMTDIDGDRFDKSFATRPNLVVIDGGKGQLNAAVEAMAAFDLPRVAVISLAKREEEVFVPGSADPIVLDHRSAGLQLLQRARDEAHRFALGFHRTRRHRDAVDSIFDSLPGVGPARRRLLMRHFGTADALVNATRDDLESVPGLPAKVGRGVYSALHRTD